MGVHAPFSRCFFGLFLFFSLSRHANPARWVINSRVLLLPQQVFPCCSPSRFSNSSLYPLSLILQASSGAKFVFSELKMVSANSTVLFCVTPCSQQSDSVHYQGSRAAVLDGSGLWVALYGTRQRHTCMDLRPDGLVRWAEASTPLTSVDLSARWNLRFFRQSHSCSSIFFNCCEPTHQSNLIRDFL